jgi:hypothetical protein
MTREKRMTRSATPGRRSAAKESVPAADLSIELLLLQARRAKQEKRRRDYLDACEAWLDATHGVHVGDSVKVSYVDEVREVFIENFELHWPIGREVTQPTLVFEGPTIMTQPRRVEQASNWCTHTTPVCKKERPSARLRRELDKFTQLIRSF